MSCLLLAVLFSFAPALARAQAEPDTLPGVVQQPVVEVSTSRAGDRTPQAVSRLKRDELRKLDWGQDTPMAFATQPGAFAYSDAGNGIGYSYLTLRGFPQRRISVLVNGVPLNDPESHEVYWIDHPELLSATSEVQIQRGVGSALYGAAALGGSVNVETSPFGDAPLFSVAGGGGTFGTRRLVVEGASGPLTGGWSLYGRYARVETDGYRDDSWSRLWSYVLGARRECRNERHGGRTAAYHHYPFAVVVKIFGPLLRMNDRALKFVEAGPFRRVAPGVVVIARAEIQKVTGELSVAVVSLYIDGPPRIRRRPTCSLNVVVVTDLLFDAVIFRGIADVVQDRGSIGDRLRIGPRAKAITECVHVGVRTDSGIAKQVPCPAHRTAAFEDEKALVRTPLAKMTRAAYTG